MKIEVSRIFRFDGDGPVKAMVDVVLDDVIVFKGIKVIEGKKGLRVSMPGRQGKDGKWYESVSCLTDDFKQRLEDLMIEAYKIDEA